MPTPLWPLEKTAICYQLLIIEGHSTRFVAKKLGTTRNAIIGKCNRGQWRTKHMAELERIAEEAHKAEMERQRIAAELIARAYEQRKFSKRCSIEGCLQTVQVGRHLCAEHIRETIPVKRRGWTGMHSIGCSCLV